MHHAQQRAALAAAFALALSATGASAQQSAPASGAAPTPAPPGLSYQSENFSVRLYGLIDATLGTINHANDQGQSKVGFDATPSDAPWFSGARWGITGQRHFGDEGVNIIFRLENEYLVKDGSADDPNAAFGRDAWVGVQNASLGKLTFGRQNTVARDFAQIYGDAYGTAGVSLEEGGWTNSNNFKQMIFYAGSATGTRYDSGVVWKKAFDGGITAGVGYQFGEVPGSTSTGSTQSVALGWNGGAFNAAGYYTHANVNGQSHQSASIGGDAIFDIFRVNAGFFHYTADQAALGRRTDNAWTLSTKIAPPGKIDYELGYQVMRADNAAVNAAGNVINAFNDGSADTGTATGSRKTVYGSVFYHFDKTTEVYVAADHLSLTGDYHQASTHGYSSQSELGVGIRLRF